MLNKTCIFIDNLTVNAFIGVYDNEKKVKQKIIIDTKLYFSHIPLEHIDLDETIDYAEIARNIEMIIHKKHWLLLENLAEALLSYFFKNNQISHVFLRINKPDAIHNAHAAGIIIEKSRDTNRLNDGFVEHKSSY